MGAEREKDVIDECEHGGAARCLFPRVKSLPKEAAHTLKEIRDGMVQ